MTADRVGVLLRHDSADPGVIDRILDAARQGVYNSDSIPTLIAEVEALRERVGRVNLLWRSAETRVVKLEANPAFLSDMRKAQRQLVTALEDKKAAEARVTELEDRKLHLEARLDRQYEIYGGAHAALTQASVSTMDTNNKVLEIDERIRVLWRDKKAAEARVETARLEVEQCHAKSTCCCGDYMKQHTGYDGHSPVAMYDYALDGAVTRAEAEAARVMVLAGALDGLFGEHEGSKRQIMAWLEEEVDNQTCADVCDKTWESQGCPSGTCALLDGRDALKAACKRARAALSATPAETMERARAVEVVIVKARRLMNVSSKGPFHSDARQRRDLGTALKALAKLDVLKGMNISA